MTDNITLPRFVVQEAAEALEFAERNHGGDDCYAQEIANLYTALAAPSEDIDALRRDAERYKWVLNWLWRYGLLSREKTRIDTPESFGDWFVLRKPHSIGLSVGYGETEDAAIDAAMKGDKT